MDSGIGLKYRGDTFSVRPAPGFEMTYEAAKKLRDQQNALQATIDNLQQDLTRQGVDMSSIQGAFEKMNSYNTHLREHCDRVWGLIPPATHITPQGAAKAQEVFSTPELLENILTFLDTPGKLDAMLVQRVWRDTVLGSVRLLRLLGILPYEDKIYYSAFSRLFLEPDNPLRVSCYKAMPRGRFERLHPLSGPGGLVYADYVCYVDETETHGEMHLSFSFDVQAQKLDLGTRTRSMLLASPSIYEIIAGWGCTHCEVYGDDDRPQLNLSARSKNGFTVGELLDREIEMVKDHVWCSKPSCYFTVTVELDASDPQLIKEAKKRKIEREEDEEFRRAENFY